MNKILSTFLLLSSLWLLACNSSQSSRKQTDAEVFEDFPLMTRAQKDSLFDLFYTSCDTVIRHHDTAWVVNRKYDTTIVYTGIFYYLPYDHQFSVRRPPLYITIKALELEKQGKHQEAITYFRKVIAYEDSINKAHGDHGELCADANSLLEVGVNNAILASFAFVQLGDTANAVAVLKPWLANVESHSGIYSWFSRLCQQHYGKAAWARELDGCFETVHRLADDSLGETSDWAVTIFGASVGIGNADDEGVTTRANVDRTISWFFCTDPELM